MEEADTPETAHSVTVHEASHRLACSSWTAVNTLDAAGMNE
jgi:hypothetical protein